MTRKRFIKLLMWAGMSRNDAADCAALAQDAGRAYSPVLGDLLNWHRHQFSHRALDLAWLKIRYTIIHGAGTPAWSFFRDIDEMHNYLDMQAQPALLSGTSKICVTFTTNAAEYAEKLRDVRANLQKLSAALGGIQL